MKIKIVFLSLIFFLNFFVLQSTPEEREALLGLLGGLYFNPDSGKKVGDEGYREEQIIEFLINLQKSDRKALMQLVDVFFHKCSLDPLTIFVLGKNNLLGSDEKPIPSLVSAFGLCDKIAQNYNKENKKTFRKIILSFDNVIFIFTYALVKFRNKYDASGPTEEGVRRRRNSLSTLNLSYLAPLVRPGGAGAVRSFEEILDFISKPVGTVFRGKRILK